MNLPEVNANPYVRGIISCDRKYLMVIWLNQEPFIIKQHGAMKDCSNVLMHTPDLKAHIFEPGFKALYSFSIPLWSYYFPLEIY